MNPIEFTNQLKADCGENLESIILYGSAARGDFQEGHSDYNTMLVLKDLSPVEVAKANRAVKKWVKAGNPPPLFFSREAILSSADVFPIEFLQIKESHKVLLGNNPFDDMKIDLKNLRHQCEFELRSKLLTLKQMIALRADDNKALLKLMLESSSSFFAIFCGVLALSGSKRCASKKESLEQLTLVTGINLKIFREIIDAREGKCAFRKEDALEKLEQYLTSIRAVVRYVDTL